jgi:glycosyltransferase involved in cell wall biosynthesis
MPSGSETFGLAALEAMACNVPVVASNIGGLPELVIHGETGFLCPLNNVDAFSERVRQIITNDDLQNSMGLAARKRAVDFFATERIIPMYMSFYEKTIAQVNGADTKGKVVKYA